MAVAIMDCIPRGSMAGGAIARSRFTNGQADQFTGRGGMAAGAGIVGLGPGTDQGVVVTAGAAGTGNGDDTGMIRCGGVRSLPGAGMTLAAIASRCGRSIG